MGKLFGLLMIASVIAGSVHAQALQKVSKCVQDNGALKSVMVNYNTSTGEYTVPINGEEVPFERAYPMNATYAGNATWYIANDAINVNEARYVKYGLPRILGVTDVSRMAEYNGVPIYVEAGRTGRPEVIYIPVRPDCEFQPYQIEVQATPPIKKKIKIKKKS